MKAALFNVHDLVVVAVLLISLALAVLNACRGGLRPLASRCLTVFYLLVALIALDTLLFWGDHIKSAAFELSPWLLTVFCFSTFAAGPLLLWSIRLESGELRELQWPQLLHLAPAFISPIYLYFVLYQYPLSAQRDLLLGLGVYQSAEAHFALFDAMKKAAPVLYGLLSLAHFHPSPMEPPPSGTSRLWLKYLVGGFFAIACWSLAAHVCGLWLTPSLADTMGIAGNYLSSVLLAWLVVFHLRPKAMQPSSVQSRQPLMGAAVDESTAVVAEQIRAFIETEKPYLDSRLTLERFSKRLQIPPRQVSAAVNGCFHQNFQEYINSHRVAEAKRLLSDSRFDSLTTAEIAARAGFNSKASFYRIFKASVGSTPTTFRRQRSGRAVQVLALSE